MAHFEAGQMARFEIGEQLASNAVVPSQLIRPSFQQLATLFTKDAVKIIKCCFPVSVCTTKNYSAHKIFNHVFMYKKAAHFEAADQLQSGLASFETSWRLQIEP